MIRKVVGTVEIGNIYLLLMEVDAADSTVV
jgi:hypothetical protein